MILKMKKFLFGFRFSGRATVIAILVLVLIVNFHAKFGLETLNTPEDFATITKKINTKVMLKKYNDIDAYRVKEVYQRGDLRSRLAQAFPYTKSPEPLQKNIWQLWKTKIFEELEEKLQEYVQTFKDQEAPEKGSFNYTLFANSEQSDMVKDMFAEVPEVWQAYEKLPKIILQADFMRYLVIYARGGMYSDVDTSLTLDAQDWLTYKNPIYDRENQIGCVVGVESDSDDLDWQRNWTPRRLQFCQWTLQAKRGHPVYRDLIARITETTLNNYDEESGNLTIGEKTYNINNDSPSRFSAILEWTGPAVFTDTVFNYMNEVYKWSEQLYGMDFYNEGMVDPNRPLHLQDKIRYHMLRESTHNEYDPIASPLGWQNFTYLEEPVLFDDDLLILPVRFFRGKKGERDDYTHHHFKGTWKND